MRKVFGVLAVLLACINAQGIKEYYIGVDYAMGSGEYTYESDSSKSLYSTEHTVGAVKIGGILEDDNRLELSFNSVDVVVDGLADKSLSGIDVNYIITDNRNEAALMPFLTIGGGYYVWEDTGALFVSGEDLVGAGFNIGIGALIPIGSSLEIEATYRYKGIVWQEIDVSGTIYTPSDSMSLFYVGAKFIF